MTAQPVSFRFTPERIGDHVEVTVRCGPEGSRALCGKLTVRPGEWSLLRWLLATTPPLETNEAYIPHWARGQATVLCHTPIDMTPVVVDSDPMRPLLDRFDAVRASYPTKKDQTDDLVETRESRQQERCPEEPAPHMTGPAPQPTTGTDSTSQARSARDGKGGAPGVAPSHPSRSPEVGSISPVAPATGHGRAEARPRASDTTHEKCPALCPQPGQ